MAETRAESFVKGPVPRGVATDVERSVDFYRLRGTELRHRLQDFSGRRKWVCLARDQAEQMFACGSDPVVASQPAVLFDLYSTDRIALREHPPREQRLDLGDPLSQPQAEGPVSYR
jgi:hypothetical protein